MKKILIVNPFGIGDVLFTTPLIANLKDAYPDSYIGYVCNTRAKDILLNNPKVDRIFIYEKDQFRKLWRRSKILCIRKFFKLLSMVKKKRFDVVFDLSMAQEYGFLLWWIGIKKRIGYDYRERGVFLTDKVKFGGYKGRHVADYYLGLLKFLGIVPRPKDLEFPVGPQQEKWARDYLRETGVTEGTILIGIIPGGGASWGRTAYRKQWPVHRYANLANQITAQFQAKIILLGDYNEVPLCNQVSSLMKTDPLMACGDTTISRFAAIIKNCRLVICNDGGPLHIAVSQGVRNISIFGPVDPQVYGPYPASANSAVFKSDLACRPCYENFRLKDCAHAECLSSIGVKEVMSVVEDFMGNETGGA